LKVVDRIERWFGTDIFTAVRATAGARGLQANQSYLLRSRPNPEDISRFNRNEASAGLRTNPNSQKNF